MKPYTKADRVYQLLPQTETKICSPILLVVSKQEIIKQVNGVSYIFLLFYGCELKTPQTVFIYQQTRMKIQV